MKKYIKTNEGYQLNNQTVQLDFLSNFSYRKTDINGDITVYDSLAEYQLDNQNNFDLDDYKYELETAIDALVNKQLNDLWYRSVGEVAMIINTPESKWNQEAIQLSLWYNSIYDELETYLNTVDENSKLTISQYINSIPALII